MSFQFNTYDTSLTTYSIQEYCERDLYMCIETDSNTKTLYIAEFKGIEPRRVLCKNIELYLISRYTGYEINIPIVKDKKHYLINTDESYVVKYDGFTIACLNRVNGWNILFEES